ncbi:hypothetical protein [Hyphobacterium indicum]|uniref:hypothetical protein n=1 Tax=Hyphobacterium indicum TaxID=2162714 RepID=UPI000D6470A7|nr:hypothetical protein [Hyphobacterium indicum]
MSEFEESKQVGRKRAITFGVGGLIIAISMGTSLIILMQPRAVPCGETLATVVEERHSVANTSRGAVPLSQQVLQGDDGNEYVSEYASEYFRVGERVRVYRRCANDGDVQSMPDLVERLSADLAAGLN